MESPIEVQETEELPRIEQLGSGNVSTSSLVNNMGLASQDEQPLSVMIKEMQLDVKRALEEVSTITTHDTNLEKQYNEVVAENQRLEAALKRARRRITSLTGKLTLLEMAPNEVRENQRRQLSREKMILRQESMLKNKRVKNSKIFNAEDFPSFQDRSRTVNSFGEYIDHNTSKIKRGGRTRCPTYPSTKQTRLRPAVHVKRDPLPPSMAGCTCSVCNTEQSLGSLAVGNAAVTRSHQQILLGDRVIIRGEHLGVVRYIGKVDFDNRPFIGVALDAPIGICDGQMYGKRYFTCPPKHGVLVRPTDVYSVIGRKMLSSSTGIPRIHKGPLVGKRFDSQIGTSVPQTSEGSGFESSTPLPETYGQSPLTLAQELLEKEMSQLLTNEYSDSATASMSKRIRQLKKKQFNKIKEEPNAQDDTNEELPIESTDKPETPPKTPPPSEDSIHEETSKPIEEVILTELHDKDLGDTGFVTIVELTSVLQKALNITKPQVSKLLVSAGLNTNEGKGIKYNKDIVQQIIAS